MVNGNHQTLNNVMTEIKLTGTDAQAHVLLNRLMTAHNLQIKFRRVQRNAEIQNGNLQIPSNATTGIKLMEMVVQMHV